MDFVDLLLNGFVCLTGLALHFSMKWFEARNIAKAEKSVPPGFRDYLSDVPAQTAVSVLATIGAFTVMFMMDWLNPGMSFACGYMGNSIAENLAGKFGSQV